MAGNIACSLPPGRGAWIFRRAATAGPRGDISCDTIRRLPEPPLNLSRRQFIGLAAAATAATGLGVTLGNWWEAPADAAFAVLSPEEARFLDVLADAAFPPGGDPAIGGSAAGAARYVDGILLAMVGDQRSLLRLSFHAFDAATLPTHGAHFSALDAAEAQAVMLGWLRSPIPELRSAFTSVYLFIGMAWTTHPEVVAKIAPMFRCGYGR